MMLFNKLWTRVTNLRYSLRIIQITIEVTDPRIKDGINKYILYTVRGIDKNGQFDAPRRYNDFQLIRTTLISKWPGCYIPPLPPKKAFVRFPSSSQGKHGPAIH